MIAFPPYLEGTACHWTWTGSQTISSQPSCHRCIQFNTSSHHHNLILKCFEVGEILTLKLSHRLCHHNCYHHHRYHHLHHHLAKCQRHQSYHSRKEQNDAQGWDDTARRSTRQAWLEGKGEAGWEEEEEGETVWKIKMREDGSHSLSIRSTKLYSLCGSLYKIELINFPLFPVPVITL